MVRSGRRNDRWRICTQAASKLSEGENCLLSTTVPSGRAQCMPACATSARYMTKSALPLPLLESGNIEHDQQSNLNILPMLHRKKWIISMCGSRTDKLQPHSGACVST